MKARTYGDALFHCVAFAHAYDVDGLPHVERVMDGQPEAIYDEIFEGVRGYEPIETEVER